MAHRTEYFFLLDVGDGTRCLCTCVTRVLTIAVGVSVETSCTDGIVLGFHHLREALGQDRLGYEYKVAGNLGHGIAVYPDLAFPSSRGRMAHHLLTSLGR
jgi:hypothetical protein